ncbi:MAG: hypothetical protein WD381_08270 [Balneolaceae bacterium]
MEENIINNLNDELENVIDEGREMLHNAELKEKFEEARTEAELLIRKHPIQSVIAGAIVGYFFAKLFKSDK